MRNGLPIDAGQEVIVHPIMVPSLDFAVTRPFSVAMRRGRHLFVLAVLAALIGAPASAQYNGGNGMTFSTIYGANANMIANQMVRDAGMQAMRASIMANAASSTGDRVSVQLKAPAALAEVGKSAPKRPITATDFRPTGKRDVPEQLAASAAPGDRQPIVNACRKVQAALESDPGFRRNNLAYALGALLGISLQVAHGVTLGEAEGDALLQSINDALATAPDFQRMSLEARTRLYDTALIAGGLMAGIAQQGQATGNAAMRDQALAMARDALATFGFAR